MPMRVLVFLLLVSILLAACQPGSAGTVAPGSTDPATASPSPDSWLPPPVPTISGERIFSVSEAIAARDDGTAGSQTIDVGGYWSYIPLAFSCPAPNHEPNRLELLCQMGYGITERYEMAWIVHSNGNAISAGRTSGPVVEPYVPSDIWTRLTSTMATWPVPIVVAGHFNDPGAAACVPDARERCEDAFVIESILVFDPDSAPTPTPSPNPTPFPDPTPPGLFDAKDCAGDVPYSFVGWATADQIDADLDFTGHAWTAVTENVVPLGDWYPDPNVHGHSRLTMGRRVCFTYEMFGPGISFTALRGTVYRLWDDGQRTSTDDLGVGSGDPRFPTTRAPGPRPDAVAVAMRGEDLADLAATITDWSSEMLEARPATADELALPGSETGNGSNVASVVLPDDPRSVLVVMAECGSDKTVEVTITADRMVILLVAGSRTDCHRSGARRGAVLTFASDVPTGVTAYTGL